MTSVLEVLSCDRYPLAERKGVGTSFTTERMLLSSLSTSEKTSVLLSAVATQIRANSQAFHEFISALNEDILMQHGGKNKK